jgi:hypothetical protein
MNAIYARKRFAFLHTRARNRFAFLLALVGLSLAVLANHSEAGTISSDEIPTLTISVEGFNGPDWEFSPAADVLSDLPGGGRKLGIPIAQSHILGNRASVVVSQLAFDPDPFVLNNILVTNTTATPQIFSAFVGLPTTFPGPNLISGNVRTDVIDGGGAPGASLSSVSPTPIYAAQIDSSAVATLQDHPFSIVAPAGGSAGSAASFGPIVNTGAVTGSIGIQLRFMLSAGDTASILSRFDVVPVPEPSTFLSGALGLMAFVGIGWRRRR